MSFHVGVLTRFRWTCILLFDRLNDTQSTVVPDDFAYESAIVSMAVFNNERSC
jgi:hypothetical protein